jgi:hypothetical protein
MSATVTLDQNARSVLHEDTAQALEVGSLVKYQQMIGEMLPELIERSARDPFFRESLVEDSRSTIESVLSHRTNGRVTLPDYLELKVIQDTESVTNVVVPTHDERMRGATAAPTPVCEILIAAGEDTDLRAQLVSDPVRVLEARLAALGYPASSVKELGDINVHVPEVNEVLIVLPKQPMDRVPASSTVQAELNLASWYLGDEKGADKIVASYTSTAFTYCGNECSSNICSSNKSYCSC